MYFLESKGKGLFFQKIDFLSDLIIGFKCEHEYSNAIIEVSSFNKSKLKNILSQIEAIGIPVVEIRVLDNATASIDEVLSCLKHNIFRGVSLITPYIEGLNVNYQIERCVDQRGIDRTIMYDTPEIIVEQNKSRSIDFFYMTSEKKNNIEESKKNIKHFSINIDFYTESMNYNVGLNGKVCIDEFGNVKNYLSHKKIFGNVNDVALIDIIKKESFKRKWFVTKDAIETCNKCQYRYMCNDTDDIVRKEDKFFKKTDCNYDPYEDRWT